MPVSGLISLRRKGIAKSTSHRESLLGCHT
jgi:hypothetical protein